MDCSRIYRSNDNLHSNILARHRSHLPRPGAASASDRRVAARSCECELVDSAFLLKLDRVDCAFLLKFERLVFAAKLNQPQKRLK